VVDTLMGVAVLVLIGFAEIAVWVIAHRRR
jgi:hypothetical protein